MKNQNTTTQIAYIVTADYYTNGKPTTCKITVQPVNFDPARLIDWSDRISKTHIREVENFTTPEEAAKRMTEIIEVAAKRMTEITEVAAERAAQIQRPESVTERHHLTVPRLADLAALPAVHA